MLTIQRANKLQPLLDELWQIAGITEVLRDDFNSYAVDVFLYLDDGNSRSGSISSKKPYRFKCPIRSIKTAIKKACKKHGFEFNFLQWPEMTYYSDRGEKIKDGYDCDHIKIEVFC